MSSGKWRPSCLGLNVLWVRKYFWNVSTWPASQQLHIFDRVKWLFVYCLLFNTHEKGRFRVIMICTILQVTALYISMLVNSRMVEGFQWRAEQKFADACFNISECTVELNIPIFENVTTIQEDAFGNHSTMKVTLFPR